MAPKKRVAADPPSPPAPAPKGKRVRKTAKAVSSYTPEAPGWQLSLEELSDFIPDQVRGYAESAKTKDEFYNRMQVVFCCLYYRCHHYSKEMMQALIGELKPQVFRLTSHDTKGIAQRFQTLQTEIVTRHTQLATYFVKHTERGQAYTQEATRCRGYKSKIPHLGSEEILEALQLSSKALRLLWMPIVPVATGEWAVSVATDGSDLGNCAAYFRSFTGDFVGIIARLCSRQISTGAQVAFFSANSHPKVDREWPKWNIDCSEINLYQNGVFLSECDRKEFNTYVARISTIASVDLEVDIAEIASLANVGVRGLVRYTMERIAAENRVLDDAIDACGTTAAENKSQLTELCHVLAEQEKKAKWFREQQDKFRL